MESVAQPPSAVGELLYVVQLAADNVAVVKLADPRGQVQPQLPAARGALAKTVPKRTYGAAGFTMR